MKKPIWLSWSSGKDSAYSFYELSRGSEYEITGLVTTVTKTFDRVSMHGTRRDILHWQADTLGVPLYEVEIPAPCTNAIYESTMSELITKAKAAGVAHMAFGDLFLEDVKAYRERMLQDTGITPVFPLWARDTRRLSQAIVDDGFRATITCVDPKQLAPHFVGRLYDHQFLADLPPSVDPCGENGEFHSVVTAGPIFNESLSVRNGDIVRRDGFVFADVQKDLLIV